MGRGIFSGLFWGSTVSALALMVGSQLAPIPPDVPRETLSPADAFSGPESEGAVQSARFEAERTPSEVGRSLAPMAASERDTRGDISKLEVPVGSEFRRALPDEQVQLPGLTIWSDRPQVSGVAAQPHVATPGLVGDTRSAPRPSAAWAPVSPGPVTPGPAAPTSAISEPAAPGQAAAGQPLVTASALSEAPAPASINPLAALPMPEAPPPLQPDRAPPPSADANDVRLDLAPASSLPRQVARTESTVDQVRSLRDRVTLPTSKSQPLPDTASTIERSVRSLDRAQVPVGTPDAKAVDPAGDRQVSTVPSAPSFRTASVDVSEVADRRSDVARQAIRPEAEAAAFAPAMGQRDVRSPEVRAPSQQVQEVEPTGPVPRAELAIEPKASELVGSSPMSPVLAPQTPQSSALVSGTLRTAASRALYAPTQLAGALVQPALSAGAPAGLAASASDASLRAITPLRASPTEPAASDSDRVAAVAPLRADGSFDAGVTERALAPALPSERLPETPQIVLAQASTERDVLQGQEVPDMDLQGTQPLTDPDTPVPGAVDSEGASEAETGIAAAPDPDTPDAQPVTAPEVQSEAPIAVGVRVIPLTERETASQGAVITTRLPRIGIAPESDEDDAAAPEIRAAAAPEGPLTALVRNAVPFDPPVGVPLVSVVLIYAGDAGLSTDLLAALPVPVTVAIDPGRDDAAEVAATLYAAGVEIITLATGFPVGAQPSDVDVTLSAQLAAIPESIGLMDDIPAPLGGSRDIAEQAAQILAEDGHGLLLWDRGLNSARAAVEAFGVETGLAFRLLDSDRERSIVIGRYLDRAAFKATQEGSVVMVGHTYGETITALTEWALEGRGTELAIAPLSAVLQAQ